MSDSSLVKISNKKFPTVEILSTQPLSDVLTMWNIDNRKPVEITRADVLQHLTITHDPLDGRLSWRSSGPMDALTTIWLSVMTAISIGKYFTRGAGRIDMPTGEIVIVMGFKNGRLSIIAQPENEPIAAEKLLTCVLAYLWEKNNGNPVERFIKMFGWDT